MNSSYNNKKITGTNIKPRHPFYDKLTFYFCAFSGPSISGNGNGFFISLSSKKQDFLDM